MPGQPEREQLNIQDLQLNRRQRRRLSRRTFLISTGVLGATAMVAPSLLTRSAPTADALLGPGPLLDLLRPVFQTIGRDTYAGLSALVVPGPDVYSVAQGVTTPEPAASQRRRPSS